MSPHARDKGVRQSEQIEDALRAGKPVVVDNTNPRVVDREPLIALGRRYGARVIGYFFPPHVGESIQRNEGRDGRAKVPKVAIFLANKRMQAPAMVEGFDELYEVRLVPGGGFDVRSRTS